MEKRIITQEDLLTSEQLRNKAVTEENLAILEKIKAVSFFPKDLFVGVRQAANYYEVSVESVKKCIQRNKEELEKDGLRYLTYEEIVKYRDIAKSLSYVDEDGKDYIGSQARAFIYIPRKALLRLGMLLKRSKVAIQVRSYLLNIEDISTEEQKVESIQEIANEVLALDVSPAKAQIEERKIAIQNMQLDVKEVKLNNRKELAMIEKYAKKAVLLGIPQLEASILIQETILANGDIEKAILDRLKSYDELRLTIARGRVRSQLSIIAETLFENDYELLYHMLSDKLRPVLGINMRASRERLKKKHGKYSKQVPSYLDYIADYKAWDHAEKALEEIKAEKLALKAAAKPRLRKNRNAIPEVK